MNKAVESNNNGQDTKEEIDEIFEIVADKLNEHGIPWWVTAGSMLGCYREGKRIEWDHDYDLGYPIEYAPSVLEALLEIPDVYISSNLYFRVGKITDILSRDHFVCLKPFIFTDEGVYRVTTPLSLYSNKLSSRGFHTIPVGIKRLLNKIIRKFPLCIQKAIVEADMETFIPVRFRGPKEEYSSWYQTKMGDVDVKLPIGVESILERLYGDDYMTPKREGEYELGGDLNDYPDP